MLLRNPIRHAIKRQHRCSSAIAVDPYSLDLEERFIRFGKAAPSVAAQMTPRKLQIVSDLHLEFRRSSPPRITKYGNDLALLGDIGHPFAESYRQFLSDQAKIFDNVFVLLGNHEYYSTEKTVDQIRQQAQNVCDEHDNVHLLDRSTFDITEHTRLIGTTLWSDIDYKSAARMSDFKMIRCKDAPLTREQYVHWHHRDVSWLEKALITCREDEKRAVVLTHHGPCLAMAGKYHGSMMNSGFVTDLTRLFQSPAIAYASGHVHSNCDTTVNGIRSVSNALGYPGEATGYKDDVVIDII